MPGKHYAEGRGADIGSVPFGYEVGYSYRNSLVSVYRAGIISVRTSNDGIQGVPGPNTPATPYFLSGSRRQLLK